MVEEVGTGTSGALEVARQRAVAGERLGRVETRLDTVETRLTKVESTLDDTNTRVRSLEDTTGEIKELLIRALER